MLAESNCSTAHILREGNQAADAIAMLPYLRKDQDTNRVVHTIAPEKVQDLLAADMAAIGIGKCCQTEVLDSAIERPIQPFISGNRRLEF